MTSSTLTSSDAAMFHPPVLAVRAPATGEEHTYTRLEQYRAHKRQLVGELTTALRAGAAKGIEPTVVLGWRQNTNRLRAAQRTERFIRTLSIELTGQTQPVPASA